MRTSIKLLAALLCVLCGQTATVTIIQPASVAACATSDTTLPHDEVLEGFQTPTTGYENTWTAYNAGAEVAFDPVADTSALATGKPAGACDQACKVTVASTSGSNRTMYWDNGEVVDVDTQAVDFYAYLWVDTAPGNLETFGVLRANNSTTSGNSGVASVVLGTSGVGQLQLNGLGNTTSATENISTGQWYKIKLHISDTTDATSYMQVNDGTQRTFERLANDWRYVHFGMTGLAAADDSGIYYIDLITANTP